MSCREAVALCSLFFDALALRDLNAHPSTPKCSLLFETDFLPNRDRDFDLDGEHFGLQQYADHISVRDTNAPAQLLLQRYVQISKIPRKTF